MLQNLRRHEGNATQSAQAAHRAPGDPALPCLLAMVQQGAGNASGEAWQHWPALLGLAFWSPAWAAAAYEPDQDALAASMDCMALTVPELALALPAAAEQVSLLHLAAAFAMY